MWASTNVVLEEPTGKAMLAGKAAASVSTQEQVALDYGTAVRGILNNDQGGPLQPPGLEMAPEPGPGAGLDPAEPGRQKRGPAEKHLKRLAG